MIMSDDRFKIRRRMFANRADIVCRERIAFIDIATDFATEPFLFLFSWRIKPDGFKIGRTVLAQRADIIRWQGIAFVDIAADFAAEAAYRLFSGLWLGFDVVKVIIVSNAEFLIDDLGFRELRNKESVCLVVVCTDYLTGNVCVACFGQIGKAIFATRVAAFKVFKFINIASTLVTKAFEDGEINASSEHADVKHAGFYDHIMRVVEFIHSYSKAVRHVGDLVNGIDDAAVILFTLPCGKYKQAITDLEKCVWIYKRRFLL